MAEIVPQTILPSLMDLSACSEQQLVEFIRDMDKFFKPSIAARINLSQYVQKLKAHGIMLGSLGGDQKVTSLIGFYANDKMSHVAFITYLAVHPELQGKQVGKALVHMAMASSFQKGMRSIKVTTWSENSGALKLYQYMGFKETDRQITSERTTVFLEAML